MNADKVYPYFSLLGQRVVSFIFGRETVDTSVIAEACATSAGQELLSRRKT